MIFNDLDYLSRIQCRSWYRKRKNEFASRWKRRMICYLERRESVKIFVLFWKNLFYDTLLHIPLEFHIRDA